MARIVLDTNVYILGFQRRAGDEWLTLQRVQQRHDVIVFSRELEDQIRRVGRRVGGKDYVSLIFNTIWRNLTVDYVLLPVSHSKLPSSSLPASQPRMCSFF